MKIKMTLSVVLCSLAVFSEVFASESLNVRYAGDHTVRAGNFSFCAIYLNDSYKTASCLFQATANFRQVNEHKIISVASSVSTEFAAFEQIELCFTFKKKISEILPSGSVDNWYLMDFNIPSGESIICRETES